MSLSKPLLRGEFEEFSPSGTVDDLITFFKLRAQDFGSINQMAEYYGISHGNVSYLLKTGSSPTLIKQAGARKHPIRHRITFESNPIRQAKFNQAIEAAAAMGIEKETLIDNAIDMWLYFYGVKNEPGIEQ